MLTVFSRINSWRLGIHLGKGNACEDQEQSKPIWILLFTIFFIQINQGDYHRLGHGTVDHVRRPKKVAALQGIKIVSIATGSLHCVACCDMGRVYTFGDNDEVRMMFTYYL